MGKLDKLAKKRAAKRRKSKAEADAAAVVDSLFWYM
jgi:hypothetical protein